MAVAEYLGFNAAKTLESLLNMNPNPKNSATFRGKFIKRLYETVRSRGRCSLTRALFLIWMGTATMG